MRLIYMRPKVYTDPNGIKRVPYVPFEVEGVRARVMWGREKFVCDKDRLERLARTSTDASIVVTARNAGRPGLTPKQARAFVASLLDEEPADTIAQAVEELEDLANKSDDYESMSRDELRDLCIERGLGTGRSREELLAKLLEADEAALHTSEEE